MLARRLTRWVGLTALGWAVLVAVLVAVAVAAVVLVAPAHADEVERFTPSSRGTRPEVTRWRPLLEEYADWDVDAGLRVIDCESGGDPAIWNRQGSGAVG